MAFSGSIESLFSTARLARATINCLFWVVNNPLNLIQCVWCANLNHLGCNVPRLPRSHPQPTPIGRDAGVYGSSSMPYAAQLQLYSAVAGIVISSSPRKHVFCPFLFVTL